MSLLGCAFVPPEGTLHCDSLTPCPPAYVCRADSFCWRTGVDVGPPPDMAAPDTAAPDASTPDASSADAASLDASSLDAMSSDADAIDAVAMDTSSQ
jgi:hypothetical protein